MRCCLSDLRDKEVVNIATGQRLGYVCDAEIDMSTGQICAFLIPGGRRLGGLLPGEADFVLPWSGIVRIGDDIILVDANHPIRRERPRGSLPG